MNRSVLALLAHLLALPAVGLVLDLGGLACFVVAGFTWNLGWAVLGLVLLVLAARIDPPNAPGVSA